MNNRDLRVLIVDDVHSSLLERFEQLSVKYSYQPSIRPDDISSCLKEFNALVVRSKILVDESIISANPQLKLIARAGSGMDNIDLNYANRYNIQCINAPEANSNAVGEQAVGMLLSLNHNLVKSNKEVSQGLWNREGNRGVELAGKTVGIVGFGHTGVSVANKLAGFGCTIIAYDKYKKGFGSDQVMETDLAYVMSHSDIISFHIPLTEETSNWISKDWINLLAKKVTLLNLSRGGIMKTEDVIEGLKNEKIEAFATDVLENEILTSYSDKERENINWLNSQNNVLITPHIGGWTKESYVKISTVLANKIEEWLKTDINTVNTIPKSTEFVV